MHNNATDYRDRWTLVADTENNVPSTFDAIYRYSSPGRFLSNPGSLTRQQISGAYNSPKNSFRLPDNALGEPVIVTHDGTDALNKRRGSVHVIRTNDNWQGIQSNQIAGNILFNDQQQYTSTVWMLGNADPTVDAFTCRYDYNLNPPTSELLILLQPLLAPYVRHWDEHSLHNNSCDTFIHRISLRAQAGVVQRTYEVLFTTGYHSRELMLTWTNANTGFWMDPENIAHRVIGTGRKYNYIHSADVNGDGNHEILVSIRDTNGAGLELIEIPTDFRTGQYIFHPIITGLTGRNAGAGGQIRTCRPITGDTSGKLWIIFAGAENGRAYVCRPTSADPKNFSYEVTEIPVNTGNQGFISGVECGDVDGDGRSEVFLSSQGQDAIQVWTFA